MVQFTRSISDQLIRELKQNPLFNEKLLLDIKKTTEAVFPAIRNDLVGFYYKGGGLFTYSNSGFKTHYKYAVAPADMSTKYLSEENLQNISIKTSYLDAYENVKERCKAYGTQEAGFVSKFYGCSGVSDSPVILLDTEIAFSRNHIEDAEDIENIRKIPRIDILLYNIEAKELCFCEAKHFSNNELWAKKGNKPDVCAQISEYNSILANEEDHTNILVQYQKYIVAFNQLFDIDLPMPQKLCKKVGLLVFGYDSFQKEKIHKLLIADGSLEGIPYYTTGDITASTIVTLFDRIRN